MIELDADEEDGFEFLSTQVNGELKIAERDIVQFVQFDQFKHDPKKLAQETLEEIPKQVTQPHNPQFLDYMESRDIKPELEEGQEQEYQEQKREQLERENKNAGEDSDGEPGSGAQEAENIPLFLL